MGTYLENVCAEILALDEKAKTSQAQAQSFRGARDKLYLELHEKGYSYGRMAELTGRSYHFVARIVKVLKDGQVKGRWFGKK